MGCYFINWPEDCKNLMIDYLLNIAPIVNSIPKIQLSGAQAPVSLMYGKNGVTSFLPTAIIYLKQNWKMFWIIIITFKYEGGFKSPCKKNISLFFKINYLFPSK